MTVPTNAGFAEMAKHATGTGTPLRFTYIAVGEGSGQGAGDTALDDEVIDSGLARTTAGTITTVQTTEADDTGSWVHVFTATGTKAITEAAIFNASSGGDMLIVGTVSPTASMVNGDTLTLTMKCQFLASS